MKYLLLFASIVSCYAQDESFRASVYGLNNGEIYVINGTYVAPKPNIRENIISDYRRINEELSRDINHSFQMSELRRQTRILEEQNRLLRKIADE